MEPMNFENELKRVFAEQSLSEHQPKAGHELRFMQKLSQQKASTPPGRNGYVKYFALAASLLLIAALLIPLQMKESPQSDLADVSLEMAETQAFFTNTIKRELAVLAREKSPENKILIEDALEQLAQLEQDYENLKTDLTQSGQDKRVIHAMISNFQKRIALLEQVLEHIEVIKTLKQNTYENAM